MHNEEAGMRKKTPIRNRIESKIEKKDGCWNWTGLLNRTGYGIIGMSGRAKLAHRISFEAYAGRIPELMCVLHKCDNRRCVNPDHLFIGTRKDNADDRGDKGRSAKGESNGQSKLSEMEVLQIIGDHRSQADIARSYGVSGSTISRIKSRKSWLFV